ncbi:MAG: hypothetical protein F4X97_14035 [Boseongicola sp. SB0662_bin_57]|nr:hypothetical protein [Boseongicola sp. SB0662_bin_57]
MNEMNPSIIWPCDDDRLCSVDDTETGECLKETATETGVEKLIGTTVGELIENMIGMPPVHPSEGWCRAKTKEGNRCLNDVVADGLCTTHWRQKHNGWDEGTEVEVIGQPPTPKHPSEDWCRAVTQDGKRCLKSAVEDGLCTAHWRQENNHLPPRKPKVRLLPSRA